jgi:hypothetical protein
LQPAASADAALVAPTPRHTLYPENIRHRYSADLRWIQAGSVQHQHPLLIDISVGADTPHYSNFIDRRTS